MRLKTLLGTLAATGAAAAAGSAVTDPGSDWYRSLDTPSWQPPPLAYPLVWTPLYLDVAVTSAHVLETLSEAGRTDAARRYRRALGLNLVLNAGWNALFFAAHRPGLASVECAALTVSSVDLTRRAAQADGRSAAALAPYAAWCGFATVLTVAIARRNRR